MIMLITSFASNRLDSSIEALQRNMGSLAESLSPVADYLSMNWEQPLYSFGENFSIQGVVNADGTQYTASAVFPSGNKPYPLANLSVSGSGLSADPHNLNLLNQSDLDYTINQVHAEYLDPNYGVVYAEFTYNGILDVSHGELGTAELTSINLSAPYKAGTSIIGPISFDSFSITADAVSINLTGDTNQSSTEGQFNISLDASFNYDIINKTLTGTVSSISIDNGYGNTLELSGLTLTFDELQRMAPTSFSDFLSEVAVKGSADMIQASKNYELPNNFEILTLTGDKDINGYGNALNNILTGNIAANILDGRGGADKMSGGRGNDTYIVNNIGDVVVELTNQGNDTIQSSITLSLGTNLENLFLTGVKNINGIGNNFANTLVGNEANNGLSGLGGNDILRGSAGIDSLKGGAGNDVLFGGRGADIFIFDAALSATTNVDTIQDYDLGGIADKMQLDDDIFTALGSVTTPTQLAVSAFVVGTQAMDANDRIIYNKPTGALYYDADGVGTAAQQVQFAQIGVTLHPILTASDFLVIN
ncbi:serralysin [Gammaproteobacteria bacterium]